MQQDHAAGQGHWLWSWRTGLLLLVVPAAILVFPQSGWMEQDFGESVEEAYDLACFVFALCGFALRVLTAGYGSARSTDSLVTTGVYSLVRHPLSLANFVIGLGVMLTLKNPLFVLFGIGAYLIFVWPIMRTEDRHLEARHGELYRRWAARTPAFLPRLRGWVPPAQSFAWREALRRETPVLFLIASLFFASEVAEAHVIDRLSFAAALGHEWIWVVVLAMSGTLSAVVIGVDRLSVSISSDAIRTVSATLAGLVTFFLLLSVLIYLEEVGAWYPKGTWHDRSHFPVLVSLLGAIAIGSLFFRRPGR